MSSSQLIITKLEQQVLDEYSLIARNLDEVSSLCLSLATFFIERDWTLSIDVNGSTTTIISSTTPSIGTTTTRTQARSRFHSVQRQVSPLLCVFSLLFSCTSSNAILDHSFRLVNTTTAWRSTNVRRRNAPVKPPFTLSLSLPKLDHSVPKYCCCTCWSPFLYVILSTCSIHPFP